MAQQLRPGEIVPGLHSWCGSSLAGGLPTGAVRSPFFGPVCLRSPAGDGGAFSFRQRRSERPKPALIGRPCEPRGFPFLDLIGQSLESCGHAQEPLPYFRVSRLDSECPQHCGSLQVVPRPRLFVGHYQHPAILPPDHERGWFGWFLPRLRIVKLLHAGLHWRGKHLFGERYAGCPSGRSSPRFCRHTWKDARVAGSQ